MNTKHTVMIAGKEAMIELEAVHLRLISRMDGTPTVQDIIDDQTTPPLPHQDVSQWVAAKIFHAAADELERKYDERNNDD